MQVHAPAAGPPLHSGGPQKLRQFLAVSGLPLTVVIISFLRPAGGVNHPDSVSAKVGKLAAKKALR